MRAACLLVCLTLAHGISGSIFKPQVNSVQPQQYDSQYHQQESQTYQQPQPEDQRNKQSRESQSRESQQSEEQHSSETQYYKTLQQQLSEQLKYQRKRTQRQSAESHSEEHKHHEHHHVNLHYRPYHQYPQTEGQSKERYNNRHKDSKHNHHGNKHHQGSSSSSESQSKESKERRNSGEKHTQQQYWNSNEAQIVTYEQMGPIVMWHEQQIPSQQQNVVTEKDIREIFTDAQTTMKGIKQQDKVKFHQEMKVAIQQQEQDEDTRNATQLAQKYNYPVEEHTIKTDDGYLLTLFRVPPKKQARDVQKRPVAFLMHGLLGSADDWLLMGPGKSLAFLLADEGYDVWLGNARGNKYARRHVSKHPAVPEFWQFSIDEIAQQDLPTMIDYTLKTTNQDKLHYIGHSLGATAFFALTASKPEYNEKIIMMHALSPVVYMANVRSPLFRMIAPNSKFAQTLQAQLGKSDFSPKKELLQVLGGAMCQKEIGCENVCSNVNFVMTGVNVEGMEAEVIARIMKHLPAGTSTRMIKHYAQGVASKEFKKYDYGPQTNEEVYGQSQPPRYDLQKVTAPVALHYSEEDWLAHPKDVTRLQTELPNVNESNMVPEKHFSHMDFQFSKKAPELVYNRLINAMQKQETY